MLMPNNKNVFFMCSIVFFSNDGALNVPTLNSEVQNKSIFSLITHLPEAMHLVPALTLRHFLLMNGSNFNVQKICLTGLLAVTLLMSAAWWMPIEGDHGLGFVFKQREWHFVHKLHLTKGKIAQRGGMSQAQLDTASHHFDTNRHYVEIVRQDHATTPQLGIAMGFEFDPEQGDFPYTPAYSVLQLKDFRWGGVEFDINDTLNFTGVTNDVSDDLQVTIEGFDNDTIWGEFSGVLLNGAGQMASIERGWFRVRLYRK
jgi:hypothetical protein